MTLLNIQIGFAHASYLHKTHKAKKYKVYDDCP